MKKTTKESNGKYRIAHLKRVSRLEPLEDRSLLTMVPMFTTVLENSFITQFAQLTDGNAVLVAVPNANTSGADLRLVENEKTTSVNPSNGAISALGEYQQVNGRFFGTVTDNITRRTSLSSWAAGGDAQPLNFAVPGASKVENVSGFHVDAQNVVTVLATAIFEEGPRKDVLVRSDGRFADLPKKSDTPTVMVLIEGSNDGKVLIGELRGRGYGELLVYDPGTAKFTTIATVGTSFSEITAADMGTDGDLVSFVASTPDSRSIKAIYATRLDAEPKTPTRIIGSARDNVFDPTETSVELPGLKDPDGKPIFQDIPFAGYFLVHNDIMPDIHVSNVKDEDDKASFSIGYRTSGSTQDNIFRITVTIDEDTFHASAPDPVIIPEYTDPYKAKKGTKLDLNGEKQPVSGASILDMDAEGNILALATVGTPGAGVTSSPLLKTEFARRPVLVVPGIVGSFPNSDFKDWVTQLGMAPERLVLDPIADTYKPLVDAFVSSGYEKGKDLFEVGYDWRLAPAPRDSSRDGVINFPEINSYINDVRSDKLFYGVDYLVHWILEAQTRWAVDNPGHTLDSVDVIAHSTGGLLTRAYAQSTIYGEEFSVNGNQGRLPEINSFVMAAVPNFGAPKALNFLRDNFASDSVYAIFIRPIANTAFQTILKGGVVNLPSRDSNPRVINLASLAPDSEPSKIEEFVKRVKGTGAPLSNLERTQLHERFIDMYASQIRGLVTTEASILSNGIEVIPQQFEGGLFANIDLLDLNSIADKSFLFDGKRQMFGFASVVHGSGYDTIVQQIAKVNETDGEGSFATLPIDNVFPSIPDAGVPYFESVIENKRVGSSFLTGDGTVPRSSLVASFASNPLVNHVEYVESVNKNVFPSAKISDGDVSHVGLLGDPIVVSSMIKGLGHYIAQDDVDRNGFLEKALAALTVGGANLQLLVDPVNASLIDPTGRRFGYDKFGVFHQETENSFYYGDQDGLGVVFAPELAGWKIEINGLGGDYLVDLEGSQGDSSLGFFASGLLAVGEQLLLDLPVVPPDRGPVAGDESVTVSLGSSITIPILANDHFEGDSASIQITTMPGRGQAEVLASGALRYTAEAVGEYTVEYTISDSKGRTSQPGNLSIRVNQSDVTPTDPVIKFSPSAPGGASDPVDLPSGAQPSSWSRQRSMVREIAIELPRAVTGVSPSDLVLTNLGVNADLDSDTVLSLSAQQLSLSSDGKRLIISLNADELPDGVYQLDLLPSITGGSRFTVTGDRINKLFVLKGDWNGDGGVSVQDFSTFGYWFLSTTAPDYVDLRSPPGVNIQDFSVFASNFGKVLVFPSELTFPVLPISDADPSDIVDSAIINSSPLLNRSTIVGVVATSLEVNSGFDEVPENAIVELVQLMIPERDLASDRGITILEESFSTFSRDDSTMKATGGLTNSTANVGMLNVAKVGTELQNYSTLAPQFNSSDDEEYVAEELSLDDAITLLANEAGLLG